MSSSGAASSGRALSRSCRSPPAKKVFFAEVTITPLMESFSASRRSIVARSEVRNTEFMVFTGWVGSSMVRVTIPASSVSQPNMLMSVTIPLPRSSGA